MCLSKTYTERQYMTYVSNSTTEFDRHSEPLKFGTHFLTLLPAENYEIIFPLADPSDRAV
jgi:hypothetical protein